MEKTCIQCSSGFEITDEDLAFYEKISPEFSGKKEQIPPPTLCPDCRQQRRMANKNQIYVYKGTSCVSGAGIISMFPETADVTVMDVKEWWEDRHNPLEHGEAFDESRTIFQQMRSIFPKVPLFSRAVLAMENSDYSNNASYIKNGYLVSNASYVQDSFYCDYIFRSKDCAECTQVDECELCYDCTYCKNCYNVQSSKYSHHCSDSAFLAHCRNCTHCFGCVNLQRKEYCIFNEQLTPEEYEKRMQSLDLGSWSRRGEIATQVEAFWLRHPVPAQQMIQAEEATGNFLTNVKNVHQSFFVTEAENIRYSFNVIPRTRDCMDLHQYGDKSELLYECNVIGDTAYNILFSSECWDNVSNLLYCMFCIRSHDCFACIGLHNKSYCILNKQYTKEEYEELVPEIITHMRKTGDWGEFFPMNLTPYAYNHTVAQSYYPLTKEKALQQGVSWYEREIDESAQAIDASALPDGLPETDDAIIVRSSTSGRSFKITSQEIKHYRALNVPLPRTAYDERFEKRYKKLGGIRLFGRSCVHCNKPLRTTYKPDDPEIIYCKECYLGTVY